MNVRRKFGVCLERDHLRRTGLIAVVVGTWLTFFNHVDLLFAGSLDPVLFLKVALNYATPFAVANMGLLSRQGDGESARS
jgi:hypothetical protein